MTWSGERSALDPDPVPVHHRLRDLLARHPEGPLPAAELEAIRKSLHVPRTQLTVPPKDFQSLKQASRAAAAPIKAVLNAADPSTPEGLDELGARLRSQVGPPPRIESADVHLSADQSSPIASHLLQTGTTAAELLVALNLAADLQAEVDSEILRETALLGGSYGFLVSVALRRKATAPHDLYLCARPPARAAGCFFRTAEEGRAACRTPMTHMIWRASH
jgi:hypothetical protein